MNAGSAPKAHLPWAGIPALPTHKPSFKPKDGFSLTAYLFWRTFYHKEALMHAQPIDTLYWCVPCEHKEEPTVGVKEVFLTAKGTLRCPRCGATEPYIFQDEPFECDTCHIPSEEGRECTIGDPCLYCLSLYEAVTCFGSQGDRYKHSKLQIKAPRKITWVEYSVP
jgi:DNA-directed RNA polymerase subunit RPC12/RpoP